MELLEGYPATFWSVSGTLGQAIIRLQTDDILHPTTPGFIAQKLAQLRELAEHLNLRATQRACGHFREYIDGHEGPLTHQRLREIILHIMEVVGGELEDRTCLLLSPEQADLYRNPIGPIRKEILDAFGVEDISEAAKCLALNRSTATVFHLMRAMERAVQRLSEKLDIPKPDRAWGVLLSDIHRKIELMPKGTERSKWSEIHAHLYHVKEAWRNDTMHPKLTYTFEEAKAVFEAVKVFMSALVPLI